MTDCREEERWGERDRLGRKNKTCILARCSEHNTDGAVRLKGGVQLFIFARCSSNGRDWLREADRTLTLYISWLIIFDDFFILKFVAEGWLGFLTDPHALHLNIPIRHDRFSWCFMSGTAELVHSVLHLFATFCIYCKYKNCEYLAFSDMYHMITSSQTINLRCDVCLMKGTGPKPAQHFSLNWTCCH